MPLYGYKPLKESLQEKGYKPEDFDYICVADISNVDGKKNLKWGGRRVWLMQKDMGQ